MSRDWCAPAPRITSLPFLQPPIDVPPVAKAPCRVQNAAEQFTSTGGQPLAAALEFRFHSRIADIDAAQWDALAAGASPFLRHAFLNALEATGCATADTGWAPQHLLLQQEGRPVAAMPLYLKRHSWGEYVFDWSWADAYRQYGMAYYPKLVSSVPFTPSSGPRLLLAPDVDRAALTKAIADAVTARAEALGASSWHVLFPTLQEHALLSEAGLRPRIGCQYHWYNRDYTCFEDFLATFNSRKRKNLRKEREAVHGAGIHFRHLSGRDITPALWQTFHGFYQSTYEVRGQQGYLTQAFFEQLGRTMPENLLLVLALHDDTPIAAALSLRDDTTLYGRYWGSRADYQFLHFETCYYQGIDYCITQGLQRFDSGAQGEHKIQRGFEPIITYSNHWIADPRFDAAIGDFLLREAEHIRQYRNDAAQLLPFRLDLPTATT
jgi:predicted N-acyltransferase